MLHDSDFLQSHFEQGLTFASFVNGLPLDQQHSWHQRFLQLELDTAQRSLVGDFTREMRIMSLTGPWCGESALQGAALARIAEAAPDKIDLRFLPKDEAFAELIIANMINAGTRVPITFLMAEDFEPCARIGDRSLSRYRSMARKALGEAAPVFAPPPEDPVRTVLQELLDEVERVQWMLRLSPRLQARHGEV